MRRSLALYNTTQSSTKFIVQLLAIPKKTQKLKSVISSLLYLAGAEAGVEGVHPSLLKWTLGRHKIFLSRSQSLSLSLGFSLSQSRFLNFGFSLSISVSQFRVLSLKLGFFLSILLQTTTGPDLFFPPKFLSLGLLIVFLFCVLISDKGNNVVPLIFIFIFFITHFF